jgi:hypothetical protein
MAEQSDRPTGGRDQLDASTDVHEVLRCTRGTETRIYNLRAIPGGGELLRITKSPGAEPQSVKECDFQDSEQVSKFLEEVRRSLIAGGWQVDFR